MSSNFVDAANIDIQVSSDEGKFLPNIGVVLEPLDKSNIPTNAQPQIMDQIDTQFVPHFLIAQKSALVSFPNSDSIKHNVYSFSEAKTFELKLYRDRKPAPLPFEKQGEVILGCNIHDWMLGYIYVVDTPWFGKTDKSGLLNKTLPEGEYKLTLLNPQLQREDLDKSIKISVRGHTKIQVKLMKPLLPKLDEYEDGDEFDEY